LEAIDTSPSDKELENKFTLCCWCDDCTVDY